MFVYQAHEVGGREAHKIVGVELLFYPPNFVFPPRFTPQFCGGMVQCLGQLQWWGVHQKNINGCSPKNETLNIKSCSTEFPVLLRDKKM